MYPLLGITGQKGAGKSTVATYLAQRYGYTITAFADDLKSELAGVIAALMPERDPALLLAYFEDHKHDPVSSPSGWVRQMLQAWGMMRRDLSGEHHWLARVDLRPRMVVADVRFPNEAHYIAGKGGKLVHIYRPSLLSADPHPSERQSERLDYHALICNDHSISELFDRVDRLMARMNEL